VRTAQHSPEALQNFLIRFQHLLYNLTVMFADVQKAGLFEHHTQLPEHHSDNEVELQPQHHPHTSSGLSPAREESVPRLNSQPLANEVTSSRTLTFAEPEVIPTPPASPGIQHHELEGVSEVQIFHDDVVILSSQPSFDWRRVASVAASSPVAVSPPSVVAVGDVGPDFSAQNSDSDNAVSLP